MYLFSIEVRSLCRIGDRGAKWDSTYSTAGGAGGGDVEGVRPASYIECVKNKGE